ncbi:hypothetical protein [Clostridium sp.]|uniref:hypothetical protein n=1 Tax=Clostridium sp. TaxID=1506 RepID=UPI00260723B3|nr:hypothetical protein [uncultured Clostridium sp.]
MDKLNKNPIRTNVDESIKIYNHFCTKAEVIKANFVNELIHLHVLEAITDYEFNEALRSSDFKVQLR